MSTRILLLGLIGIASVWAQESGQKAPPKKAKADAVNYYRDIEPILNASCVSCHQESMAAGGLRLDAPETRVAGRGLRQGRGSWKTQTAVCSTRA